MFSSVAVMKLSIKLLLLLCMKVENKIFILTFNRFKYLCEKSGATPASVSQQN